MIPVNNKLTFLFITGTDFIFHILMEIQVLNSTTCLCTLKLNSTKLISLTLIHLPLI